MAYHFDERALICQFAKDNADVPELEFIRRDNEGIMIKALTGGTVNYIFRVSAQDENHSVVIKYGEEKMRADPSEHVDLERQVVEYDSLILMESLFQGSAPKAYCFDCRHNILAIEDLSKMTLLGDELKIGKVSPELAKNIGKTLSIIHRGSTKDKVSSETWQEWQEKFGKEEQIAIFGSWSITRIFDETDSTVAFTPKTLEVFRKCVQQLEPTGFIKKTYDLFATKTCFIHADCHWEAMFVKDDRVKIFDFEYSFLSRPAMQLGWVLASYPPCMLHAISCNGLEKGDLLKKNKEAAQSAVLGYLGEAGHMDEQKKGIFLGEVALFAGEAEILNANWATIGLMVTNTEDDKIWLTQSGTRLMLNHENIRTVEKLVDVMFAEM